MAGARFCWPSGRMTKQYPGRWSASVAGTLEPGETYESNIYEEANEELGIEDMKFEIGPKVRVADDYQRFCQFYFVKIDRPADAFVIQGVEVANVKWVKIQDLSRNILEHPDEFTPPMGRYAKILSR